MLNLNRHQVYLVLCCCLACIIPWHERWNAIVMIILVIFYLFDKNILAKLKMALSNKWTWPFFTLALWYVIGASYSDAGAETNATIERKLPLLLLPFIFSSEPIKQTDFWRIIFKWFTISVTLASLYCIYERIKVCLLPHLKPSLSYFMYELLASPIMHPGYFSNYIFFAIALLTLSILKGDWYFKKPIQIVMIIYLIIFLAMLTSKTVYIVFGLFFIWTLLKIWLSLKKASHKLILLGLYITVVGIFGIVLVKLFPGRFHIKQEIAITNPGDIQYYNSVGSRKAALKEGLGLIADKWVLGYGTGTSNIILKKRFEQKGYVHLVEKNMHTHNQFIKTSLEVGIIGLALLLLIHLIWGLVGWRNYELLWLSILSFVNCATDDMWDIQAGVVFFLFWGAGLFFYTINKGDSLLKP